MKKSKFAYYYWPNYRYWREGALEAIRLMQEGATPDQIRRIIEAKRPKEDKYGMESESTQTIA